jgi:CubicO group peptidase (beta-lactamase class C family)
LPSVAAAVVRDGETVWADAVGLADVDAATPASPETQYRVGSITKTFTAAAIFQLRDAGALELDDALERFLPDSPHPAPTLRRLLAHLSGLQREPAGEIWESLEAPDRDAFLADLGRAEQVLPPGAAWHYSNLAYALLGEVVERASGIAYAEYVEARLLRPLGLVRTTWTAAEPAARGYFVQPFSETVTAEPPVDLRGIAAAGQLWSTVGDLARWGAFLADPDPTVLDPASAEEMRSLQAMSDLERWTLGWGLGLGLYRRGDRVWAGHDGAMPGFLASLVFRAQERVGAAVLTNTSAGATPSVLAIDLAEAELELSPPAALEWRPQDAPPPEVAGILGRWWSEGEEFVFRFRDGRLEADALSFPEHRRRSLFAPDGDDGYRVVSGRERGERLRVVRDERGEVVRLYWATYPFTRTPETFG